MRTQFAISNIAARNIFIAAIFFVIFLTVGFLSISFIFEPSRISFAVFNLSGEKNVPATFSAAQLFLVGIVFLSFACQPKNLNSPPPFFISILGLGFIYLSFDEFFSIHEAITVALKEVEMMPRFKGNHGIWVAPYLMIGLVFFVLSFGQFLKLWKNYRRETIVMASGLALFLLGAVVMEVIGYQYLMDESSPKYLYKLEVAAEEFLEMLGISIVLYGAALLHQKNNWKSDLANRD